MQIILKKDVQNLGEAGDVVTVKDGYARNFLLPSNLAQVATKGSLEARERDIARIKAKAEKLHAEALETAEKIEKLEVIKLSAKAGESGKLFGTITTKKLAEEIQALCGVEVDRKLITLDNPINKVGNFTMTVKLTSKVKAVVAVSVEASETVKETIVEEVEATEEAAE
ncbi:50S ribosomal protein L9 [bacterium]|nr:50S ribosomal protein L9 [bacterium]